MSEEKIEKPKGIVPYYDALRVRKLYDGEWNNKFSKSKMRAYLGTNQTVTRTDIEVLELDTESYDINIEFDTSTFRFTAKEAGYYLVVAQAKWLLTEADKQYTIYLYKNGVRIAYSSTKSFYDSSLATHINDIVSLVEGDYLDIRVQMNGVSDGTVASGSDATFLAIHKL